MTRWNAHKYGAKRTEVDGITFDSRREADYYAQLKLLERAGEIVSIECQPRYEIIKPYTINGKKVRPTYYIADFKVTYKDGREEIIDCKGFRTKEYRLKKKLFESKYGIEIKEA